jgi:hypothetical protein
MNLTEFERHANSEFAKHSPRVLDGSEDLEQIVNDIFPPLEKLAITERLEICERSAWLLVTKLFNDYLWDNCEELRIPAAYFKHFWPSDYGVESLHYVDTRRHNDPARHSCQGTCALYSA